MQIPLIIQGSGLFKYTPDSGNTIPYNFATMFLTDDCTMDVTDHFDHEEDNVLFRAGYYPIMFKKIRSISNGSVYLCHNGNQPSIQDILNPNLIEQFKDYYRLSLNGHTYKVYYQHRSSVASNYIRIWSPINDNYAWYWDIKDHDSPTEEYINFGRGGIIEYYRITNPDFYTGTFAGSGTSTSYLWNVGSSVSISFKGTKIYHKFFSDNRGGIIRWTLKENGEEIDTIDVSTYTATGQRNMALLFSNLNPSVSYTMVGTFIGDDPANPPSGGVSRGWVASDGSTSGSFVMEKAFWIVGSPNPNSAYPLTNLVGQPLDGIEFVGFSNKDFAFFMRKSGSTVGYAHVPLHTTTGNATTFTTLSTDRTLKADGGSNLLDTFTTYNLATECNEIVLSQIFKGHNSNEPLEELIDVNISIRFDYNGPKVSANITALQNIDAKDLYASMFPNNTSKFDTLIYQNGESDTTITDGSNETLFSTTTIGDWNGNAAYVNRVGSSEELKYGLSYKLSNPTAALKVGTPFGQYLFIQHRDTSIQKLYPVLGTLTTIPTGTTWSWESYFAIQLINEGAYNRFKE